MTRERYLVKHLEAHEGSRPYRCDYDGCKKGFETQELLNAHWEHVHIGDVSVYKCPMCEKGTSTCYKNRIFYMDDDSKYKRPFMKQGYLAINLEN